MELFEFWRSEGSHVFRLADGFANVDRHLEEIFKVVELQLRSRVAFRRHWPRMRFQEQHVGTSRDSGQSQMRHVARFPSGRIGARYSIKANDVCGIETRRYAELLHDRNGAH